VAATKQIDYRAAMRQLLLLRHAKTEPVNPAGDHARALVERGYADIALIAEYMNANALAPEQALVSDAVRTAQTVAALQQLLSRRPMVVATPTLYLAGPEAILHEIWTVPDEVATLLLVGHNPGLHELACELVRAGPLALREQLVAHFPTSALAAITFPARNWANALAGSGTLEHFVTARQLREIPDRQARSG